MQKINQNQVMNILLKLAMIFMLAKSMIKLDTVIKNNFIPEFLSFWFIILFFIYSKNFHVVNKIIINIYGKFKNKSIRFNLHDSNSNTNNNKISIVKK